MLPSLIGKHWLPVNPEGVFGGLVKSCKMPLALQNKETLMFQTQGFIYVGGILF